MKFKFLFFAVVLSLFSCSSESKKPSRNEIQKPPQYITILGIAQDGGYPHIGCERDCCNNYYNGTNKKKKVVSLGLVDLQNKQKWIFEATPDMATQLADLEQNHLKKENIIDGVFLTHAHIGHYTGLMYFGKEALGKKGTKVYAMPKMKSYLEANGPWSQLVKIKNIELIPLLHSVDVPLNGILTVTPFLVPHRDEYSETVGYKISGSKKTALFIPDIDKWHKWKNSIIAEVKKVDYAFLDASFLKDGEINRPMSEIPHPFTSETVELFKNESLETKNKVIFIHFNHTNPTLQENSIERRKIEKLGFRFASEGQDYEI